MTFFTQATPWYHVPPMTRNVLRRSLGKAHPGQIDRLDPSLALKAFGPLDPGLVGAQYLDDLRALRASPPACGFRAFGSVCIGHRDRGLCRTEKDGCPWHCGKHMTVDFAALYEELFEAAPGAPSANETFPIYFRPGGTFAAARQNLLGWPRAFYAAAAAKLAKGNAFGRRGVTVSQPLGYMMERAWALLYGKACGVEDLGGAPEWLAG